MSDRTFKVQSPHMRGDDVRAWQEALIKQARTWRWDLPLKVDGDYGTATRNWTSAVLKGMGIAQEEMAHGVTPALRVKVRNPRTRSAAEKARADRRRTWRRQMKAELGGVSVARPLNHVIQDSWDYQPPGHDGIDLICREDAPIFAICRAKVIRADDAGWWGKGAQPSPGHPVSDGDGIVIIRAEVGVGPIRKGMHLCYGHAENPRVKEGQPVYAGQPLGIAGYANAAHIHFMVNDGSARFWRGDLPLGIGGQDPEPIYRYAMKHG